jgi:hypothetical protein
MGKMVVKSFECKMICDVNIKTQWVQLGLSSYHSHGMNSQLISNSSQNCMPPKLTQMPCPLALGRINKAEAEREDQMNERFSRQSGDRMNGWIFGTNFQTFWPTKNWQLLVFLV